jgi:mRNA-degrading endonuclease RelE of RelBE toxin-antitoxin system
MSYEVYLTVTFQKSIKILKKKFRSVKDDLNSVIRTLEKDPTIGDPIPGWNQEIWKIRAASSDIKSGKSGGFRLIYFWEAGEFKIFLLTAYFKGKKTEIAKKEIEDLLKKLNHELE